MKYKDKIKLKVEIADSVIQAIKWEMLTGGVPLTIKTFSDLHDYCDANTLGRSLELFDEKHGLKEDGQTHTEVADLLNEIQDIADGYIKSATHEMWVKRIKEKTNEIYKEKEEESSIPRNNY